MTTISLSLPDEFGFRVVTCESTERLGEIGAVELTLRGPIAPIVLPSKVLRAPCSLLIEAASGDYRFSGIVTRFVVSGSDHTGERLYRMTLRPRLFLLELRRIPRVIRNRNAPEIVAELGREVGYDQIENRLEGTYPSLSWSIQYDESDATFLRRLCEEFGFYFRFESRDSREVLILEDTSGHANAAYPEPLAIALRPTGHETRPFVWPLQRAQKRRPGKVTLRDYDPDKPNLTLEASAAGGYGKEQEAEVFAAPGGFRSATEGGIRAQRRLEALRADGKTAMFGTNALAIESGRSVEFVDSERSKSRISAKGSWFVVATQIHFEADGNRLEKTIEAIPLDTAFRLQFKTPRPRLDGIQSAVVTGAHDAEIDCDTLGRVHVAFHWDIRGPKDATSSIPIRVAQPQAPGAFVLPRVGWEVFVMFEDGDPERPLVLGRSYNAKELPPLPLPANKTISVLATDSSPGGAARTEIRLEDKAGSEFILMNAPFGMDEKIFGDSRSETRKNENFDVKSNVTTTIGADEKVSVGLAWLASYGSRSIHVSAMQKQTSGGSFFSDIGGTESVHIGGVLIEKVGNPVKGAANLAFSAVLAGVGSRGTAGAIVAAGAGITRAAVEGYEKSGEEGAEHAAVMGLSGVAASMIPGGDAIMASITGSAKPMPWDQGRPPDGAAADGGGAVAASGASGNQGPGPGHRATVIDGSYTEIIGGSHSIMTPGAISWVTVGPSTFLIHGSHTSAAVKGGISVAGAMNESLGSLSIASAKNITRKIKGIMTSDVAGARNVEAGGDYRINIQSAGKLSIGGSLSLAARTVAFRCGSSEIIASGQGVTIKSPTIRITGSSSHLGKLTHG